MSKAKASIEQPSVPIVFTKPDPSQFILLSPDVLRDAGLVEGFTEYEWDEAEKALIESEKGK